MPCYDGADGRQRLQLDRQLGAASRPCWGSPSTGLTLESCYECSYFASGFASGRISHTCTSVFAERG
eukprot:8618800-Pyramimonas_sp.AAC.1